MNKKLKVKVSQRPEWASCSQIKQSSSLHHC